MALPPFPTVIHPLMVHFTIALVPLTAAFAVAYAWRGADWTRRTTYIVMTFAAIMAAATMGSGFRDYFRVKDGLEGTAAYDLLETHELLGVVTAITIIVTTLIAWVFRARVATKVNWRWALAIALLVAAGLVMVTGWFGGSLVYDHGVSVEDITPDA